MFFSSHGTQDISQPSTKKSALSKISGSYGFRWFGGEIKRTIDYSLKFFENEYGRLTFDPESQAKFNTLMDLLNHDLQKADRVGLLGRDYFGSYLLAETNLKNSDGTTTVFTPNENFNCIAGLKEFRNFLRDDYAKGNFTFDSKSSTLNSHNFLNQKDDYASISMRVSGVTYFTLDEDKNDIIVDTTLHYQADEYALPCIKANCQADYDKLLDIFNTAIAGNINPALCRGAMIVEAINLNKNGPSGYATLGINDLNDLKLFRDYIQKDLPHMYFPDDPDQNISVIKTISTQMQASVNSVLACFMNCWKKDNAHYAQLKVPQNSSQLSGLKSKLLSN